MVTASTATMVSSVFKGEVRTDAMYYSDQLLELADIFTEKGTNLVISLFTDNIAVLQEFSLDYSAQLSEQEVFMFSQQEDTAIISLCHQIWNNTVP